MAVPSRMLVADDTELIHRAICQLVERETRFNVVATACNYAELLKLLDETSPDVVVMDVHMPGQDEVTPDDIKTHRRGACLIAISIWNDDQTTLLAQSYGAYKLLDKVTLGTTLLPTIEECFRDGSERAPVKQRVVHP
jgi:DNA-binding NarL/FixJ family response regulator